MDQKQNDERAEALEKKNQEALKQGHENAIDNRDHPDPREKSTGHGKKTADKWNQ